MIVVELTPPPFEPVTLADVYRALRIDPEGSPPEHELDDDFRRNIVTARIFAETRVRRTFVERRLRMSAASFSRLRILRPPVIEVESVEYHDANNVLTTLDAASWYVTDGENPEVMLAPGVNAPQLCARQDAVRVTYRAGYAATGSPPATQSDYAGPVPQQFKDAILISVTMLQASVSPQDYELLARARMSLLDPFIVHL